MISALPFAYLTIVWDTLPNPIPIHFNAQGEANGFGTKSEFVLAISFLFCLGSGMSWLFRNIHKLDPKKKLNADSKTIKIISTLLVTFLSIISIDVIYSSANYTGKQDMAVNEKIILSLVSLLFAVLGNFMNNIKPNYFFGIRTPWALENEDNWRKTHHLSSKMWFFGGLLMLVLILALPAHYATFVLIGILIPLTIIPFTYSYLIHKKEMQN